MLFPIHWLSPGDYTFKIDGLENSHVSRRPIRERHQPFRARNAYAQTGCQVLKLTNQHNDLHVARWRIVQVPLVRYGWLHYDAAIADLDALEQEAITRQRTTAWPKPDFHKIVSKGNVASRN